MVQQTMKTLNPKHLAAVAVSALTIFPAMRSGKGLSMALVTAKCGQHTAFRVLRQESIGGRSVS